METRDVLDDLDAEKVPSRRKMTRAIVTALLLVVGLLLASPGCGDEGVGDPCTPEQEYDPTFNAFDEKEVNVESKSFQCRTRLCLVNHFQGRASCPYGQSQSGDAPPGAKICTVPGTDTAIVGAKDSTGGFVDPKKQSLVQPQCVDRAADKAVYCSCR